MVLVSSRIFVNILFFFHFLILRNDFFDLRSLRDFFAFDFRAFDFAFFDFRDLRSLHNDFFDLCDLRDNFFDLVPPKNLYSAVFGD